MRTPLLPVLAAVMNLPMLSAEPLTLTVHAYDLAAAGSNLDRAIDRVTAVLENAGVLLIWKKHEAPAIPWGPDNPFNPDRTPTDLIVRLLPEDAAKTLTRRRSIAGVAYHAGSGHFRYLATLFYDRVVEMAEVARSPVGVILGNLIAHELGHLLLGPDAHAPAGLMRCPWGVAELRAAERGELRFNPQQARVIRADASRRVRAAAGEQVWRGFPGSQTAHEPRPRAIRAVRRAAIKARRGGAGMGEEQEEAGCSRAEVECRANNRTWMDR